MARVSVENLTKVFDVPGGQEVAVDDVSFTVEQSEFVTIVGPSGCGKTTLLRCIAGLESPTGGTIRFDDREVTHVIPQRRDVAMVFQDIAIYSHMTAAENIVYPLKIQKVPGDERDRRLEEAAEMLRIGDYLEKYPPELSGGQRQRVALARSLVQQPEVFLFDEPTSNLDAKLKVEIRKEIQKVAQRTDQTMIYVTHDQEEAMTMSDKVVVMDDGNIMQVGPPEEVYEHPNNVFVAEFIGTPSMNVLAARCEGGVLRFEGMGELRLDDAAPEAVGDGDVRVGFRPEAASLTDPEGAAIVGEVQVVESTGSQRIVYLESEHGELRVETNRRSADIEERGTYGLAVEPVDLLYFDADSGERIASGRRRRQATSG